MAKIAIDCDGVLANFTEAYSATVNKIWPGRIEPGFIPSDWNFDNRLSPEEDEKVWAAIKATPNFWLGLRAYPENVGSLVRFLVSTKDHDIYIVTSRAQTAGLTIAKQTDKWLLSCSIYPLLNYLAVFPVENSNDKHRIYKYAGIEYSIDDKAETVEQCDRLDNHRAFLLDRKWNQHATVKNRISNMDEFFKAIREGKD